MDGRESCDFVRRRAVKRLCKALSGLHPVDAMAALETVMANSIADLAATKDSANRGLDAAVLDMRELMDRRFERRVVQ